MTERSEQLRTESAAYLARVTKDVLGKLNYYIGPGARTAVSHESQMQYWRVALGIRRVNGEPCPRCDDTGIDRFYAGPASPCALIEEDAH